MKHKEESRNVQTCMIVSHDLIINIRGQNYTDNKYVLDLKCSDVSHEGQCMKHAVYAYSK